MRQLNIKGVIMHNAPWQYEKDIGHSTYTAKFSKFLSKDKTLKNWHKSDKKTQKTPTARKSCEIINSSLWRMNVCSITSFFEKILSVHFDVCPLQMRKKTYCASKEENHTRFARIRWLCIL